MRITNKMGMGQGQLDGEPAMDKEAMSQDYWKAAFARYEQRTRKSLTEPSWASNRRKAQKKLKAA